MSPCEVFGHTWVIRPSAGHLIEICSTCGVTPPAEEED